MVKGEVMIKFKHINFEQMKTIKKYYKTHKQSFDILAGKRTISLVLVHSGSILTF